MTPIKQAGELFGLASCMAVLLALGITKPAEARTTFSVRVQPETVAGPEIEHSVSLFLSYFPGDGEAVLRTEIYCQEVRFTGASSVLGKAIVVDDQIEISYEGVPISETAADTIALLVSAKTLGDLSVAARTYSSLQGVETAAHELTLTLRVHPAIPVTIEHQPTAVYPGQEFQLDLRLRNEDGDGRSVTQVAWEWPNFLQSGDAIPIAMLENPLLPGGTVELSYRLAVQSTASVSALQIFGRTSSPHLSGSPIPQISVDLLPVPYISAKFSEGKAVKGMATRLHLTWHNAGAESIPVYSMRTQLHESFGEIAIASSSPGATARVEADESAVFSELVVDLEQDQLRPGQELSISLTLTPERAGVFSCNSGFQPQGDSPIVPLPGNLFVGVVEGQQESGSFADFHTDLEAVQTVLAEELRQGLADLPLALNSAVELEAQKKDDKNWILEDILAEALIDRGYRVAIPPGAEDVGTLRYRLVDARVVYAKVRGWNPLALRTQREAIADVFLAFQNSGGQLSWMRRISGYDVEKLPVEGTEWLGGSGTVGHMKVDSANKLVEVGLSSLIVGGLFFVFFVP